MKRTTALVLIAFAGLFLFSMLGSSGSFASQGRTDREDTSRQNVSSTGPQREGNEDEDSDPDLGKFRGRIDREGYIQLRDEYIARKRGVEPGRPFDPEARGRAIEQMERQENSRRIESIVSGTFPPPVTPAAAWTPLGPAPLPNGFGGAVSGRATAIAVDPTNPSKVYLGTAQGGVWRSLDGGATWTTIFDGAQSLAIGALALAPSDPTILYVGTGEFNNCGDCFFGVGLYRIETVDTTPTLIGPINPSITTGVGVPRTYNVFAGRSITRILVHPTNPATIFVATARGVAGSGANTPGVIPPALALRGLFRSTNATGGANAVTFQKLVVNMDSSLDAPGTGEADMTDIAMEPGVPDNLLVTVIGRGSLGGIPDGGIYRTTNALAATPSFTQVLSTPTGVRSNLAINKVGSTVTAYAATSETPTATPSCTALLSGALRKQIDPFNLSTTWSTQLTGGGGFCAGQCSYDMPIAVDPNDANVVYIGGQAGQAPASCSGVVKKSTDGGASFINDSNDLHPDDHALFFDGAGNIYTANDGGVWKRSSNAAAGSAWMNLNNASLNTLQFEGIAVHPFDRHLVIGGTQDNGTEYQQGSAGNWRGAEGGDGGYALIDQSATDMTNVTMYHTFFNRKDIQIGFDRAVNTACLPLFDSWPTRGAFGGSNNPTIVPCDGTAGYIQNGINRTDNVLFYAPMALGPGAPNTLYFGTDRLYRSTDRGDTMTVVSQGPISSGSPISTIAIWPQGDNVRMVGLQNGQVWATSTGSSALVNITSASFPTNPNGSTTNKFVGRAAIDPNNKNVAYIAFSFFAPAGQGIWKTTNLGAAAGPSPVTANWTAAGNGIPSVPINAFAIDPQNSNNLYAGTDIGVYSSTDAGASWTPFGTGLPRAAVFEMALQNANRILRVGTHGRGIWEIPLIDPGASTVQFSLGSDSVTEGELSKTVTVTRTGDITFPATVNYSTADTAGANACGGSSGGVGSSRCDYISTSGTLTFGANETSKIIPIPIVNDSYAEGTESFSITLSVPSGLGLTLGAPASEVVTVNDDDAVSGPNNQIDQTDSFVREQYIDFLNREPDPSGFNFWKSGITSCSGNPKCVEIKRIDTSAAFFISIEFQGTGYLVERLYKTAYGDIDGPSATGGAHTLKVPIIRLNEFLPDTQKIGQGVIVNQGNWQQQLEDNKQAFTEEFVQRPRFITAYPLSLTPTQFVDGLSAKAGPNVLSTSEHDQLVSDLTAGVKTRAQVLRAVAEDPDLVSAEFNRAFVLMQYFGYLRRNPNDLQDTDYAGYEFWLSKLNQFGNYQNAEMVKAFLSSSEYRHRFGP